MAAMTAHRATGLEVVIRPLEERDLSEADRIMRVAFGTFLGVPEPSAFFGDASWVASRWRADPEAAFAAELDGEVVGSGFLARWGSFGFVGPVTIRPDLWDCGIGGRLMEPLLNLHDESGARLGGLFTFPDSPKHLGLYQKRGFRPRFLTAIMSKPVEPADPGLPWGRYSEVVESEKDACLAEVRRLCDSLFDGLDPTGEVRSIDVQGLGETILLWDDSGVSAFAACHQGPQTEAGSSTCYVKFAAVRPQRQAGACFEKLLTACESFAASVGAGRLVAGVNTARHEAYAKMLQRGFQTEILGIAMHRPNKPGFSRPGVYVLDDWR